MFFGRIIGTCVGFFTLGPVGAGIGFVVGMLLDRGIAKTKEQENLSPEQKNELGQAFFEALFPILGKLAKADGRISEEEITSTERTMTQMGLTSEQRQTAIELFNQGSESNFDMAASLAQFNAKCAQNNSLKQIFLIYLISLAYADGTLHPSEETILRDIASHLGYSKFAFNHLLGMLKAQTRFYRGKQEQGGYHSGDHQRAPSNADDRATAYTALGVNEGINDVDLKKAYRRLMSEYHPDKLEGRGVPQDMVKLATERSQEIQAAYELIKKHRKAQG
ncbi:MAG: co-chaperone DjlA [Alteromonadaceae bacterium]|nr:MAG: co-chaperone DjlA [Alteromonadaceae bacterium]